VPITERRFSGPARSLGWFGLLCLVTAAWLAWPRAQGTPHVEPRLRCVLIDASAPLRRREPSFAGHLSRLVAREAAEASAAGEDLAVALFDRGARFWCPPAEADAALARLLRGDAPLGPPEPSAAADLAAGLELVRNVVLAAGRPPGSVLVVGDGTARGRAPEPLLDELAARGVTLRFEALPAPSLPDARLHELRLPRDSEPGAPLAAAVLWSIAVDRAEAARLREDATLTLLCEFRDASGEVSFERPLAWPADDAIQHAQLDLGTAREGAVFLCARIALRGPGALRDGDPLPENDVAQATGRVGSARLALALAPQADLPRLRVWLADATPGIDWLVRSPSALGTVPTGLDLVCTFDLTPDELPHGRIEALLVRGGGWFHAGGWSWLAAPRGEQARRSASWSPLSAADPEGPPVERLFLVDGSGSMRGDPFEAVRFALEGMLPLVADRDRIVLQLFSNVLAPRVVLAESGARASDDSLALLRAVQVPGGATEILDCLDVIGRGGLDAPTERSTVLLLTDGREDDALRVADRAQKIRDRFRATGRELSALAAGPGADYAFLAALVGPVGRLARAEEFTELAELFRAEVGSERTLEGADALAVPSTPAAPATARELAAAFDRSIPLTRAVRCVARDGSGVLLASPDGSPLLAMSRAAGGTAAALASTPGEAWGGALRAADLAPLWRAMARGNVRDVGITARVDGTQLVLTGCGPQLPALFEVEVRRESAALGGFEVARSETLGRLEFAQPFAASGRDTSDTRRARLTGDLLAAAQDGGLVLRSTDPLLAVPVAGAGGADYLPESRTAYRRPQAVGGGEGTPREGRGPHPGAPWVLALGLLAVFGSALSALLAAPGDPR
jgi:von Willebrand factor type A domain-containing protein